MGISVIYPAIYEGGLVSIEDLALIAGHDWYDWQKTILPYLEVCSEFLDNGEFSIRESKTGKRVTFLLEPKNAEELRPGHENKALIAKTDGERILSAIQNGVVRFERRVVKTDVPRTAWNVRNPDNSELIVCAIGLDKKGKPVDNPKWADLIDEL